jgi:hypothetical protein
VLRRRDDNVLTRSPESDDPMADPAAGDAAGGGAPAAAPPLVDLLAAAGSAGPGTGGLLRVLGVAFGLAIVVGNTIGMGILRTPGEVASHLPSVPLFLGIWVAGAVYALLGASGGDGAAAATQAIAPSSSLPGGAAVPRA